MSFQEGYSPRSPLSPVRPHVHGGDKKQDELDRLTVETVAKAGGPSHCQAVYFNMICKEVIGSENEKFRELQPKLDIPDNDYYNRAMRLVLAYLIRHRMTYTVSCIRHEYERCPRNTGFEKPRQVDQYMKELIGPLGASAATSTMSTRASSMAGDVQDVNTVPVTPMMK